MTFFGFLIWKVREIVSLATGNRDCIVIDLSYVEYIYSSFINLLIRLWKDTADSPGSFCLVNISKKCREQLSLIGIDRMFAVYGTEEEFEMAQNTDRREIVRKQIQN